MARFRIIQTLALGLIIIGLLGLLPLGLLWARQTPALSRPATAAVVPAVAPVAPQAITGKPVSISIPSLNITLPVVDGAYHADSQKWDLSLDKAHFALPTTQPNDQSGNTLIYGHYRPQVFAYLHLIKPGATAQITTDNGYVFSYSFVDSQPLDPNDTSIFTYQGPPRLTIQTCSGSFMQHRQMYYFHFDGVTKA